MRQIPLSIFGRRMKPTTPVNEEPVMEKEEVTQINANLDTQGESVAETVAQESVPNAEETLTESESVIPEEPANIPEEETSEPVEAEAEITLVQEDAKEESSTPESEEKDEPKKKRSAKKQVAEKPADVSVSMKMTGATKLMDAVALVVPEYEDPSYTEFMEHMNEALLHTVFDERADAGIIKVILSNLARCYDNATRKYAEVSAKLETVANKNYGLIVRQTAANSVGNNEAERKRHGLHAPEVYKGTGGKTVNLFAVEAGLRKEVTELQTIIKQIEFKKSAIIAYLTASKQDADV